LKPEVKATLDKIVYQVELVSKTLQLLENRVAMNEDRMTEVVDYVKYNDLSFRPKLTESVMQNSRSNFGMFSGGIDASGAKND
jgi:hypothetical protein